MRKDRIGTKESEFAADRAGMTSSRPLNPAASPRDAASRRNAAPVRNAASPGNDLVGEAAYAAPASALWQERETLDRLLFALVTEQLILRAGHVRWLATADEQVLAAAREVQELEVLRAADVDALAAALGARAGITLAELADLVPEPWSTIYADHLQALRALTGEVAAVTAENRRLLRAGAQATGAAPDGRGARTETTYGANGAVIMSPAGPMALDREA